MQNNNNNQAKDHLNKISHLELELKAVTNLTKTHNEISYYGSQFLDSGGMRKRIT